MHSLKRKLQISKKGTDIHKIKNKNYSQSFVMENLHLIFQMIKVENRWSVRHIKDPA